MVDAGGDHDDENTLAGIDVRMPRLHLPESDQQFAAADIGEFYVQADESIGTVFLQGQGKKGKCQRAAPHGLAIPVGTQYLVEFVKADDIVVYDQNAHVRFLLALARISLLGFGRGRDRRQIIT